MKIGKAIIFGLLLWIIIFVFVSALVAYNFYELTWIQIIIAVVAGLISFILAGILKPASAGTALGFGVIFVIVGLVLDYFITKRFNAEIFSSWSLWLGYLLVLFAPLLKVKKAQAGTTV